MINSSLLDNKNQVLLISLALIPILVHFFILQHFAYNLPYWDDYNGILSYLNNRECTSIFVQHNEHRIVYDRLIALLDLNIFGHIDFRIFMLVGSLSLLPVLVVFFFQMEKNLLYFLPIPYILLSQSNFENTLWGMASLQNYGFVCFCILTLYFLSLKKPASFFLAILFGTMAVYTSAAGVFIFVPGLMILISQKRKKEIFILLPIAIGLFIAYFIGYQHPSHHPPISASLAHPFNLIIFFFCFLGASIKVPHVALGPSCVFGLGVFISFIYFFRKKLHVTNPFVFFSLSFFLLLSILAALTRSSISMGMSVSFRYHILSLTSVCLCYMGYNSLSLQKEKFSRKSFLIISSLYIIIALLYLPEIQARDKQLHVSAAQWKAQKKGLLYPPDEMPEAEKDMTEAIQNKIYSLPPDN